VRFAYAELNGGVDPDTRTLSGIPDAVNTTHANEQRQYAVDLTLSGNLDWFGHREELAFGGDFTQASTDRRRGPAGEFRGELTLARGIECQQCFRQGVLPDTGHASDRELVW
jgi:hypothetical protein